MMKKGISILIAIIAASTLWGADMPVERVFVSTDREVYIAGDMVWCSLFCLDSEGKPSPSSAVSYLELVSSEGSVAQAKIGLLFGRGCGSFRIPVTVPTGVYRLVSYTSVNANEDGTPWMEGSRVLTIFNTLSVDRVKDGYRIVGDDEYNALSRTMAPESGSLEFNSTARVRRGSDVSMLVHNGGKAADFSLSIYHEDDIVPAPQENSIASFLSSLNSSSHPVFVGDRPLEYDGEIISAKINGTVSNEDEYSMATLSSAGAPSNLYIGVTGSDKVQFLTNNIYGDREIVCEVSNLDASEGVIEIENPFIYPSAGDLPKVVLNKSQYTDLASRKVALRSETPLRLDTLTTMLRHREDLFLQSSSVRRYHLDDYNRFPSVREILVEIIPQLSLHRESKGVYSMRLQVGDVTDNYIQKVGNLLVMMDGVVISDLGLLLDFDATLLEDIDLYQQAIVCGKVSFSGLVNFITKKNYVAALSFPANVKVVDFKGVSYPVAYYGAAPSKESNDLRQLLFWDPAMKIVAGGQERISFTAPDYPGRFRAVAEGIAADGTPVHHEWTFEVE